MAVETQECSDNSLNKIYNKKSLSKGEMNMKRTTLTSPFKSEDMLR